MLQRCLQIWVGLCARAQVLAHVCVITCRGKYLCVCMGLWGCRLRGMEERLLCRRRYFWRARGISLSSGMLAVVAGLRCKTMCV